MSTYPYISFCGIDCNECKNYRQNVNCQGCIDECVMLDDCPSRTCAINKGFNHCGQCLEFPCATLQQFYHDGNPKHYQAYENMKKFLDKNSQ